MIGKLYKIAEGLNNRFKDGDDPFYRTFARRAGCCKLET